MTFKAKLAAAGLALLLSAAAGSTWAAPACAGLTGEQIRKDAEAVNAAFSDFSEERYPGLARHAASLVQVLDHAPANQDELAQCSAPWEKSVYPEAALMLGMLHVENGDNARADAVLARGLLLAPDEPLLVTEAAHAFVMAGKVEESRALCDRLIANPAVMGVDRGRLLRCRGFAYIELHRYDEAEADYRESLKHDPDNPVATAELEVIARARKGEKPGKPITVNSQTGEPNR